jgi:hypothetical protein
MHYIRAVMKKIKAVIIADIVNSSLLGRGSLNALQKSLGKVFNAGEILFGFYRGDSFHALCDAPVALKTTCLLRTLAIQASKDSGEKGIDIRMAIGIGKIEAPIKNLATAKGEAFIMSGREMDGMEKEGPRLSIRCADVTADMGMAAIALFVDFILKKMTIKQSLVVHELLQGATQVETAKKLRKSQSTVSKHANAAGWNELARLLEIYEKLTAQLLHLR